MVQDFIWTLQHLSNVENKELKNIWAKIVWRLPNWHTFKINKFQNDTTKRKEENDINKKSKKRAMKMTTKRIHTPLLAFKPSACMSPTPSPLDLALQFTSCWRKCFALLWTCIALTNWINLPDIVTKTDTGSETTAMKKGSRCCVSHGWDYLRYVRVLTRHESPENIPYFVMLRIWWCFGEQKNEYVGCQNYTVCYLPGTWADERMRTYRKDAVGGIQKNHA